MPDDNEAEVAHDDNQNDSQQHVDEHDTGDDEEKLTTDAERDPEEEDGDTRRSRKKRRSSTSSRSRSRRRRKQRIHQTYDWKQLCGSNWVILSFFPAIQSPTIKCLNQRGFKKVFEVQLYIYFKSQLCPGWWAWPCTWRHSEVPDETSTKCLEKKKGATTWVTWANQLSCFTRSLVMGLCYLWSLCIGACCMLFAFEICGVLLEWTMLYLFTCGHRQFVLVMIHYLCGVLLEWAMLVCFYLGVLGQKFTWDMPTTYY